MSSSFGFLEIGKRAVLTNQTNMQTIGHNIANVNTEGYSRQRVHQEATAPMDVYQKGQLGTGVMAQEIVRARDLLLDKQVRQEKTELGRWMMQDEMLGSIQNIFVEPSDMGFSNILEEFWNGWGDLANDPESSSARAVLRQRAITLTQSLNDFDADIAALQESANAQIVQFRDKLNDNALKVADLNQNILIAENQGQNANDLRDQRDLLLDEISDIIDIKYVEDEDGTVNVYLGGEIFVQAEIARSLDIKVSSSGHDMSLNNLIWKDTYGDVEINGGKIKGALEFRDVDAEHIRDRLDELAASLIEEVNTLHSAGYGLDGSTGFNFFDENAAGAGDIVIDSVILADLNNIAAAGSNAPGDNTNALAIAALADENTMNDGKEIFSEHFAATVADLGARKENAELFKEQSEAVHLQTVNHRSSVTGVSLDEEMTELIKFQHSFNAAANVISIADELMSTIISLGR